MFSQWRLAYVYSAIPGIFSHDFLGSCPHQQWPPVMIAEGSKVLTLLF